MAEIFTTYLPLCVASSIIWATFWLGLSRSRSLIVYRLRNSVYLTQFRTAHKTPTACVFLTTVSIRWLYLHTCRVLSQGGPISTF